MSKFKPIPCSSCDGKGFHYPFLINNPEPELCADCLGSRLVYQKVKPEPTCKKEERPSFNAYAMSASSDYTPKLNNKVSEHIKPNREIPAVTITPIEIKTQTPDGFEEFIDKDLSGADSSQLLEEVRRIRAKLLEVYEKLESYYEWS